MHLNLLRNTGILCFLILTISCTPIEKSEVSISLKPELTIGIEEGDENYMFGGIATIEEDEEGNIYVLDFKFRTIKKYDKNGKFIKNIGKKGQGPGEIPQFTVDMALKNGKIYLLLINMVIIYDKDGNYLNSFKLGLFPHYILVDSQEKIILVEADVKTSKYFHVFDSNGKHLSSFGEVFKAPNLELKKISERWHPASVFLSKKGRLFVVHPFQYEILIYKDMDLERTVKRRSKNYESPRVQTEGGGYYREGGIQRIFDVGDYLMVFLNGVKKGKFIEVFDKRDFSYKGSSKIEINGYPEPTQNGSIYFSDEWRITKFKIIIKGMR
ncbi:MAG: 6-bladed beta-propeller [Candidatus Aminicenantes bacterium]|nr:6-bladed beta-propeller [Candidatus Aminicenantes bacterium]